MTVVWGRYPPPDNVIKTEQYFLLYLDFLGSKERILDDENSHQSLYTMYELYQKVGKKVCTVYENRFQLKNISIKIFSDNIIIAIKVPVNLEEQRSALLCLVLIASTYQYIALRDYRWLLRGCFTVGDLFISDSEDDMSFIWGKALVNAYIVESELAVNPRVIVDTKILQYIPESDLFEEDGIPALIRQDTDGRYFISFFEQSALFLGEHEHIQRELNAMKKMYSSNEKIMEKIQWTELYYASALERAINKWQNTEAW